MFSHFLLFVSDCIFRSLGSSFYNQLLENFQKMFKCNFCSLTYASKSNRNRKRMSDHFAGCSERSGLKFFSSDSQIGAGGVTSYFLSEIFQSSSTQFSIHPGYAHIPEIERSLA